MFKVNLFRGFLYPLTSLQRMLAAWLILPVSLLVVAVPILMSLGVFSTVSMSAQQGIGFTLMVVLVCILVGALPFTFLTGYLLRCRKEVIRGNTQLPPWTDWKDLAADGGQMDTVALLLAVPTVALVGGGLLSVGASLTNLGMQRTWMSVLMALVGSGTGLVFLLGGVFLWFFLMIFSPIATLRLALGKTPLQALSLRGMLSDIGKGWVDYVLCGVIVWAISMAFSAAQAAFFPLIIVSFPVQVYLQLVWASLLGQYARAYLDPQV